MTGSGTTHGTNIRMFQLPTKKEKVELLPLSKQINTFQTDSNELTSVGGETLPSNIGRHVGPPLSKNFSDPGKDLIEKNFLYDLAWSTAGAMPPNFAQLDLLLIGSWTSFKKLTSSLDIEKCWQEYSPLISSLHLLLIPSLLECPVCKNCLHNSIDMINDLEISHIYVHADEVVYSKLCHIIRKNPELYKCIVILIGGFHCLQTYQLYWY